MHRGDPQVLTNGQSTKNVAAFRHKGETTSGDYLRRLPEDRTTCENNLS